ncbi:MAG TPA: type IIL restriction-modification enzyme MmeI, partial [Verrucomicrobiae bacterium]|nr:type IIL restriction-modification enzyme MmeI [Verrucomicrobiae bacterium]
KPVAPRKSSRISPTHLVLSPACPRPPTPPPSPPLSTTGPTQAPQNAGGGQRPALPRQTLPAPPPPRTPTRHPDDAHNTYVFDRAIPVTHPDGKITTNFIDLCKQHHFVLETKQGIQQQDQQPLTDVRPRKKPKQKKGHGIRGTKLWDDALIRAKSQAENYVRSIPDDNPPFLLVVDVGYSIETYADFSDLGKTYTPFPDNLSKVKAVKEPGLDGRHRHQALPLAGRIDQKRGDTLNKNLLRPIPQFAPNARLDTMREATGQTSIENLREAAKRRQSGHLLGVQGDEGVKYIPEI